MKALPLTEETKVEMQELKRERMEAGRSVKSPGTTLSSSEAWSSKYLKKLPFGTLSVLNVLQNKEIYDDDKDGDDDDDLVLELRRT